MGRKISHKLFTLGLLQCPSSYFLGEYVHEDNDLPDICDNEAVTLAFNKRSKKGSAFAQCRFQPLS